MPKLMAHDSRAVLKTAFGAHSFYLLGLELTTVPELDERHYGLVELGSHNGAYGWGDHDDKLTQLADVVHHITFDRCYVHGRPDQQVMFPTRSNEGTFARRPLFLPLMVLLNIRGDTTLLLHLY